jgi:hypothetical protein
MVCSVHVSNISVINQNNVSLNRVNLHLVSKQQTELCCKFFILSFLCELCMRSSSTLTNFSQFFRCTDKKLPTKLMDADNIHKIEEVTPSTGMVGT